MRRVVEAVQDRGLRLRLRGSAVVRIGRHAIPRTSVHDRDTSWRLDAKRIVSTLTVGNRINLYGAIRVMHDPLERYDRTGRPPTRHDGLNHDLEE